MGAFIKQHREAFGAEPICKVLQVVPSGCWRHVAQRRNPSLLCARVQRDEVLATDIERVRKAILHVCGADKVWRQLQRERISVARAPSNGWCAALAWWRDGGKVRANLNR